MLIIDELTERKFLLKEEKIGISKGKNFEYYEFRHMPDIKNYILFEPIYEQHVLRNKKIKSLEKLSKLIHSIEQLKTPKQVEGVNKKENEFNKTESRFELEVARFEKKRENRKIEEERKEKKRRENEERKREKEEKERKRKEEYEERMKMRKEKKQQEMQMALERKRAEEDKKRIEVEEEKDKEVKPTSMVLTNFFGVVKSKEDGRMQEEKIEQESTIWKTSLGSVEESKWGREREENFNKFVKLEAGHPNRNLNKDQLRRSIANSMKASKKEHLRRKKRKELEDRLLDSAYAEDSSQQKKGRYVVIVYEDFYFDQYEYKGKFRKRSNLIKGRKPLAEDAELINYDLDSDEELVIEDAESLNSDDNEEEDELDDDEEAGFVVPDGYLSDEEFGDLDEGEINILRKKKGERKDFDKKNKSSIVLNFTDYKSGEDVYLDDLYSKLTVINPSGAFPVLIEADKAENDIEPDAMIELVRMTHGEKTKMSIPELFKQKFQSISREIIKKKIDEITVFGVYVDSDIYTAKGMPKDDYHKFFTNLFAKSDGDNEHDDLLNQGSGQKPFGNLTQVTRVSEKRETETVNFFSQVNQEDKEPEEDQSKKMEIEEPADAKKAKKDKAKKEKPKLNEDHILELATMVNGQDYSYNHMRKKTAGHFLKKYPDFTKKQVMSRLKRITNCGYIVRYSVFEELGIEGEFESILSAKFEERRKEDLAKKELDSSKEVTSTSKITPSGKENISSLSPVRVKAEKNELSPFKEKKIEKKTKKIVKQKRKPSVKKISAKKSKPKIKKKASVKRIRKKSAKKEIVKSKAKAKITKIEPPATPLVVKKEEEVVNQESSKSKNRSLTDFFNLKKGE